jgi:RHS repeat-associated protein
LLDRVQTGTSTGITRGYTFDANDNITTITGSAASTETIGTLTNRLNSVSGTPARAYSYDAAGNTLSYTGETFTFNQRGRMSSATASAGATDYTYNALGQMIEKSGNGGTTLLVYDEAGHILGEYGSAGGLIEETIWMGDTAVATLRPNGSGGILIYYVHTDALGTPRKVTRPSDNGLMWRWDPDTFGSVVPNGNPAGLGTFSYKLRFPGQYALSESGLNYNYFRDYDPQMGRYIESDPIGLAGGSYSTYAYAGGNPLSKFDPMGLCPSAQGNHQKRPCKNYVQIGVGAGGVALGGLAAIGGWMEGMLGVVGSPESGGISWGMVGNGLANEAVGAIAVRDGINLISSGMDGVQRNSTLADVGYYVAGERGQTVGDIANVALAVRDLGLNGPKNGFGSTLTNILNTAVSTIIPDSWRSCQTVY